ncbi:hypothetical protein DN752_19520 [Echinicola strongylocentroti]|uniref:Uncharacterized protein n=1 Tax=Echinicola strongylocentroti TaxID=1795355 RepID=A0A2Z4IP81_9BACT|nr:hypothetical protein [Echinicola strongylocentroti]AWW32153.1 hypothetical protein DN752_19520 [Echinicola strongylocentroti]
MDIKDQINSYEDACKILDRKPLTLEEFSFLPESERQSFYSLHRIRTGIEAINEGHVFDWNNWDESKYYPWWDLETYNDDPAGSGFSYGDCASAGTCANVGARLCTRTREHCGHIAKVFFEDYRNWIKQ